MSSPSRHKSGKGLFDLVGSRISKQPYTYVALRKMALAGLVQREPDRVQAPAAQPMKGRKQW